MGAGMRTEQWRKDLDSALGSRAFLTVEDITNLLGCTEVSVHNWMRRNDLEKRLPRLKIGRQIRFSKTEFIEWLIQEQFEE